MAAIGKVGSFATVQPIKDSIGDAMTATEDAGFKYREEERLANEAKAKKQEADLADMESFDKSIVPTITGYSSIDDPIIAYTTEVKVKGADLTRQMNATSDPYKKADLKMQRNKLVQGISLLNQYPKILTEKSAEIAKGILDGKYNPREVDAVNSIAKSIGSGKYKMYVDDNYVARIDIYDFDEETGQPTKVIEKGLSLGDLSNRLTPFVKSTYDTNGGIAEQIVSQYKQDKSTIEKNFTTTEKDIFTEKLDADLKRKASEIAKLPNEAFEIWAKMGNTPKRSFKENEIAEIADYIYKDLKGRYNNETKSTVDYGSKLAFSKNRDEKEEKRVIISEPVVAVKTGVIPGTKTVSKEGEKTFAIQRAEKKLGDGKIERLKEVRLRPDGSAIYVVEETYEGSSKKTEQLTPEGQRKEAFNKANAKDISEGKVAPEEITFNDIITVTETTKAPTVKTYDTNERGNEASVFAIMAENPKTGKKFKGANELNEYLFEQAGFEKQPEEQKTETKGKWSNK